MPNQLLLPIIKYHRKYYVGRVHINVRKRRQESGPSLAYAHLVAKRICWERSRFELDEY